MYWLVSEQRLAYYLVNLRETLWPNGKWAAPTRPLTAAESTERRRVARATLATYTGSWTRMGVRVGSHEGV